MWSSEESKQIQAIGRRIIPNIQTYAIPHGLQVQRGPKAVVEHLEKQIPRIIDGVQIRNCATDNLAANQLVIDRTE